MKECTSTITNHSGTNLIGPRAHRGAFFLPARPLSYRKFTTQLPVSDASHQGREIISCRELPTHSRQMLEAAYDFSLISAVPGPSPMLACLRSSWRDPAADDFWLEVSSQ